MSLLREPPLGVIRTQSRSPTTRGQRVAEPCEGLVCTTGNGRGPSQARAHRLIDVPLGFVAVQRLYSSTLRLEG